VLEKATQNRILFLTNLYKHDYISHNYLSYILVKPIKGHKYFLLFSGTGYLPMPPFSKCNSFEKAIKILFSILYFVVLICANAGILKFILKERSRNNMILLLMLMSILMITGVIIFYSSAPEPRYSVHIFMICVIFASSFIGYLLPQKIDD